MVVVVRVVSSKERKNDGSRYGSKWWDCGCWERVFILFILLLFKLYILFIEEYGKERVL